VVQRRPLRDPADPCAVHSLHSAFAWIQRPCEHREQRGLARAVRADERERLPSADVDVGPLERDLRTEPARDAARTQERLAGTHLLWAAVSVGGTSRFSRTPSPGPLTRTGRFAAGAGSSSTSTGGTPPSSHGSSSSRSPKNSHIARPAASSGRATSAPGSP